jgi:hypothetical protein
MSFKIIKKNKAVLDELEYKPNEKDLEFLKINNKYYERKI